MPISFLQRLLDLVAPRCCAVCGRRLAAGEQHVCLACHLHLPRTDHLAHPYDNEMAKLLWGRVKNIEKAVAFMVFQHGSQAVLPIYAFKYQKQPELAEALGAVFAREMMTAGLFGDIDVLIPVPLDSHRQRERGYNQSERIAHGFASVCGKPILTHVVERIDFSASQTHKDRWQRNENVMSSFRLCRGEEVKGRHVLLIDDVVTTGATVCACAKELEQAGEVRISVASLGFTDSRA